LEPKPAYESRALGSSLALDGLPIMPARVSELIMEKSAEQLKRFAFFNREVVRESD
jgi:hypothetical protein